MNKNVMIGIIVTALIVVLGIFGYSIFNGNVQPDNTDIISQGNSLEINIESKDGGANEIIQRSPELYTIKITPSGFSPKNLEINKGDIVLFLNEGSSSSWPASSVHPIHTVYPGSGISKCGTVEEENIFDACKGLANGESYSFTFNEIGTWGYHDHLIPSKNGKIIVN